MKENNDKKTIFHTESTRKTHERESKKRNLTFIANVLRQWAWFVMVQSHMNALDEKIILFRIFCFTLPAFFSRRLFRLLWNYIDIFCGPFGCVSHTLWMSLFGVWGFMCVCVCAVLIILCAFKVHSYVCWKNLLTFKPILIKIYSNCLHQIDGRGCQQFLVVFDYKDQKIDINGFCFTAITVAVLVATVTFYSVLYLFRCK